MNRQQKRALERRLRSTKGAEVIRKMLTEASSHAENPLADGDAVKLNVERIKSSAEWQNLQPAYRDFVERNADTVFIAKIRHRSDGGYPVTVDLEGCDWSFWEGDLIRVDKPEQP